MFSYVNSPTLCQRIVQKDLDHMDILQKIRSVQHVDDMVIRQNDQEMASMLEISLRNMHFRGLEINSIKTQIYVILVKIFGMQQSETCQNIPSNVKDKLLYFTPLTRRKQSAQYNSLCHRVTYSTFRDAILIQIPVHIQS